MTDDFHYEGFSSPNGTIVPDDVFDVLAPRLTEAELRVLLYIIRRTFGFKKHSDSISLKQMVDGITTRDGHVLDLGAGVVKSAATRAVRGLVEKGIVVATRNRSAEKGDEPTTYELRFRAQTVFSKRTRGGPPKRQGGVLLENTQQTVLQQTEDGTKSQSHPVLDSYPSNIRKGHAKKIEEVDGNSSPTPNTPSDLSLNTSRNPVNGATNAHVHRETLPSPATTAELRRETDASPAPRGFARPGDLLASRYQSLPEATDLTPPQAGQLRSAANPGYSEEDRLRIGAYVKDYSWKLGDRAPLRATISRAMNLYVQAHCDPQTFCDLLYQAYRMTQEQGTIRGSKTAYWFSVVADLCGLKAVSDAPPPQRGRGRGREAADTLQRASRRRPTIAGEYMPVVAGSSEGTTPERANSAPGFDSTGGGAPTGSISHPGRSTPRKPRSGAAADTSGPREEGAQE